MQLNKSSILVGAGHVGKRHAKVLSEIFEDIYIVDPNPDSLKWCKENLECNVFVYGDLSKAINESRGALVNGTALISNWLVLSAPPPVAPQKFIYAVLGLFVRLMVGPTASF